MRFNTAPLPNCKICGAEVQLVIRDVDGEDVEVAPKFCRKCGHLFNQTVRVIPGGGSRIRMLGQAREEDDFDDLDDEPWVEILGSLRKLEYAINEALPANYNELTIEELRQQIVGALWKQYMGSYPYQTPE